MVDAQDSKSCEGNFMWVQVPLPAPVKKDWINFQSFFYKINKINGNYIIFRTNLRF